MKVISSKAAQTEPCLSGLKILLASITAADVADTGILTDQLSDTSYLKSLRDTLHISAKKRSANQICLFILLVSYA